MNKRAVIRLALIPIVLVGVMIWTRQQAWARLEEDFRQDLLTGMFLNAPASSNAPVTLEVNRSGGALNVAIFCGRLNKRQMENLLTNARLAQGPLASIDVGEQPRYWLGTTDNQCGIWLGLDSSDGGFGFSNFELNQKWRHFHLSSASCRAMKLHLWNEYGDKIRTLHTPARK